MERTPIQAASLARDVYAVTNFTTLNKAYEFLNDNYNGAFRFSSENLLKGKSGGPGLIKCRTAFGFTLIGKGQYEGDVFLLFRGTQYLADWLTNVNATVSRSACGELVHDGFSQSFLSMKPQLINFFNSVPKQKIKAVHCIGHSLGGALATLCAVWVEKTFGHKPYLYTFGSPRVGLQGFAMDCTQRLGGKKIFRVYHKTDAVPVIPTWPYQHTPYNGADYYLHSPGLLPGAKYHSMTEYVSSINKIGNEWKLLAAHKQEIHTDHFIAKWLEDQPFESISMKTIALLADALQFVLRKTMLGGIRVLDVTFTDQSTLADRIAYILGAGLDLAENISNWVILLVKKMLYFLGHMHRIDRSMLTRDYIKHVLMSMQQRLNAFAKEALNQGLVQGRAI